MQEVIILHYVLVYIGMSVTISDTL